MLQVYVYIHSYAFIFIESHAYISAVYATGPAKTGHICTKYTCTENNTFLAIGHYSYLS